MMSALLVSLVVSQAPARVPAPSPWKWSDGRAQHDAWLDVQAIAEVEPSPQGTLALKTLDAKATLEAGSPRVGLWRLSSNTAASVLASLEAKLPGRFAPVFHDEPSTASKLRVPAGGVLIWLDASADAARFLSRHGLVVKQDFGKGTLLVGSAPGSATLALTTVLRADPAVKTVMPNWWFRAHLR